MATKARQTLNEVPTNLSSRGRAAGKTINPGDKVLCVVNGSGGADIHVGIYRGLYLQTGYAAVDVQTYRKRLLHKETGAPYDFKAERDAIPYPSYYDESGKYVGYDDKAWKERSKKVADRQADYHLVTSEYEWRTILQNNRMYLLGDIASGRL